MSDNVVLFMGELSLWHYVSKGSMIDILDN